ncbi:MAG: cytochrome c biogenesis protein CcdA, partial [Pseudomonadales bacterium]
QSPCLWPMVPHVMASSASKGRFGPIYLALGLSTAFALAGGLLTFALINMGLSPDAFRWFGAAMLVLIGLILVVPPLSEWVNMRLSILTSRFDISDKDSKSAYGQFGIGMLLGLVWLPCVGPTLGAAIALASLGQDMVLASITMFTFGMGTAVALVATAYLSQKILDSYRPGVLANVATAKKVLGYLMLALGLMVFTGIDKMLETLAVQYLPDWAFAL